MQVYYICAGLKFTMAIVSPPELIPDQIMTFDSGGSRNIQGRFLEKSLNSWVVRISEHSIDKFKPKSRAAILFANTAEIFSGDIEVIDVMRSSGKLVLAAPQTLFSRPRRKHPRKNTNMPTAIIITEGPASKTRTSNDFVGRRNNRILNISKTGALLAAAAPLPEGIDEILLLMGLDLDDPYSEFDQISVSARIVRGQSPTGNTVHPHGYGLEFKPMFPAFQYALDYFIDVILEEDPGQL